jgi:hypothetical protein
MSSVGMKDVRMLEPLKQYESPCPLWLMNLHDPNVAELRKNLADVLQPSLAYPGAGTDWSPIRQMLGVVYSFVFFDSRDNDTLALLKECAPTKRVDPNARLIGLCDFRTDQLMLEKVERHALMNHPHFRREQGKSASPFRLRGYWAVYELSNRCRVSLLVILVEAIRGIIGLYKSSGCSPQALVLQDHGFGLNCWRSFGEPYESLVAAGDLKWPEFLIMGWKRTARRIAFKALTGSALGMPIDNFHRQPVVVMIRLFGKGRQRRRRSSKGKDNRIKDIVPGDILSLIRT